MLKTVRQTLFRTITTGIGTTAVGFYSGVERSILNSQYSSGKSEFIAMEQVETSGLKLEEISGVPEVT